MVYEGSASVSITFTASALPGPFMGTASASILFTVSASSGYATLIGSASASIFLSANVDSYGLYEGPYVKYLLSISPTWLLNERGRLWMQSHGDALDAVAEMVKAAVLAKFILKAPEDALTYIGVERGMPKYASETTEEYRFRLVGAWEYWQWGGTKKGVQDVLVLLGYTVEIQELYLIDPLRWSEFAITVAPIAGLRKKRWGDDGIWGDGGLWGEGFAPIPDELEALESLAAGMKAAHTKFAKLEWFSEPTYNRWGDGGQWGEGGYWPDRTEVVYA